MRYRMQAALVLSLLFGSVPVHSESEPIGYSAAHLYNLANSYARAGKPGLAILYYERASLLSPADPDIQANLQYVRASSHLPQERPDSFDRVAEVASPFWMSWIGVFGLSILGAGLIAAKISSRRRLVCGAAVLMGASMVGLTLCNALALWPRLHEGIVITAATPVRVSPVPMGEALFALPEGEKVKITAEHDGFTLIQTQAGRAGWMTNSNLAPIVPR